MALPPTAFKDLLYGSDREVYEALRKARCLSLRGRWKRHAVQDVMRESARRYAEWAEAHPDMTGPNGHDRLAEALLDSPYVNARARLLDRKSSLA